MSTQPLVCQQLVELVSDYLDGALQPADRERVEAHLAGCDDCNGYVAQVRRLLELTRDLPQPELPPERLASLRDMFRTARDPDSGSLGEPRL